MLNRTPHYTAYAALSQLSATFVADISELEDLLYPEGTSFDVLRGLQEFVEVLTYNLKFH